MCEYKYAIADHDDHEFEWKMAFLCSSKRSIVSIYFFPNGWKEFFVSEPNGVGKGTGEVIARLNASEMIMVEQEEEEELNV